MYDVIYSMLVLIGKLVFFIKQLEGFIIPLMNFFQVPFVKLNKNT